MQFSTYLPKLSRNLSKNLVCILMLYKELSLTMEVINKRPKAGVKQLQGETNTPKTTDLHHQQK